MEYLDNGITAVKYITSKVAAVEGGLYLLTRNICWQGIYCEDVFSRQVDLAYDKFNGNVFFFIDSIT